MPAWTSPSTFDGTAAAPPRPVPAPAAPRATLLCALPAGLMAWRTLRGSAGADPLAALMHGTGWWALTLLLVTLAIGLLRHPALRAARRQLGLWSLAYAVAHVATYGVLEAGSWGEVWRDIGERPFLLPGALALALLLPLGATSSRWARERLGRHWSRLHRGVYVAVGLGLWHDWQQTKLGHAMPWVATAVFAALVLWRWRAARRGTVTGC